MATGSEQDANGNDREQIVDVEKRAKFAIKHLNSTYKNLSNAETIIMEQLQRLKTDEALLQTALLQSRENAREKSTRERGEVENETMKHLQAALMGDDDDDSSSSDSDDGLNSTNMSGIVLNRLAQSSDEDWSISILRVEQERNRISKQHELERNCDMCKMTSNNK